MRKREITGHFIEAFGSAFAELRQSPQVTRPEQTAPFREYEARRRLSAAARQRGDSDEPAGAGLQHPRASETLDTLAYHPPSLRIGTVGGE